MITSIRDQNSTGAEVALERGAFTISLDVELIWGTLDLFGPDRFHDACLREREIVIDRLLALFVEFEVPATWCVLGHLFLDACAPVNGRPHPVITRAEHAWHPRDWFVHDTGGTEASAPSLFGRSLVDKLLGCPVRQEIGSHSFSHVIFGDPGCSREAADSELAECIRLAQERGLELRSFAFPRNSVGHLDTLAKHGFAVFRGPEPVWYELSATRTLSARLAHLWDVVRAAEPPVVLPELSGSGLWNVPGSMIYFPMHGFRRFIPMSLRVRRAVRGLEAAAARRRVFHLWFHPTNLADETDAMFEGLRRILEHGNELRRDGRLDFRPMGSFAQQACDIPGVDTGNVRRSGVR